MSASSTIGRCGILLLLVAVAVPGAAASPPDPVELAVLERYVPAWSFSPAVILDRETPARGELRLLPGETADVVFSSDELLRVDVLEGDPQALGLCVGDGSGLCVEETFTRGTGSDPARLLWREERSLVDRGMRRARIGNRGSRAVAFGVVVGWLVVPGSLVPESPAIDGLGERRRLVVGGGERPQELFEIGPDRVLRVDLEGPGTWRVESRRLWAPGESQSRDPYRISVVVDEDPEETLDFFTGRHAWADLELDGSLRLLGRREQGWISLGAGGHEVILGAAVPLLVTVVRADKPHLSAPGSNGPGVSTERVLDLAAPGASWNGDPEDAASAAIGRAAAAACRLARDNAWSDGGLAAAGIAGGLARSHPGAPSLGRLAADLRGLATFPRELLPEPRPTGLTSWTRTFEPPVLEDPSLLGRPPLLDETTLADLLRGLPDAAFHEAGPEAGTLTYRQPPSDLEGELEVVVWEGPTTARELRIRMDDGLERRILRLGAARAPFRVASADLARAGLSRGDGRFARAVETSAGLLDRPRAEASVARLALPAGVGRIEVRAEEGRAFVALRSRAARPFSLPETAYRAVVSELGGAAAARHLVQTWVAAPRGLEPVLAGRGPAARDLASHWLPLLRRLDQESSRFAAAVGGPAPGPGDDPSLDEAATTDLADRAEELAAEGQWLPAFELWARAARGTGSAAGTAVRRRIDALDRLGEEFLAGVLLRSLVVHGDEQTAAWAAERLRARADRAGDGGARFGLAAWQVVRDPSAEHLAEVSRALYSEGDAEASAALALLLPEDALGPGERLAAFLEARWWTTFDEQLGALGDADERALWKAREALVLGRWGDARAAARQAGTSGADLDRWLEEGEVLSRAIAAGSRVSRQEGPAQWQVWQASQPGPRRWRAADQLVVAHAGDGTLLSPARALLSRYRRATQAQPLELEVRGPARIAVEARLVHPEPAGAAVDDWLEIRTSDELYLEPILGDRPVDGLALWSAEGSNAGLPGRAWRREIDLGPGAHRLSVRASRGDLLVRIERLEAAWPAAGFPLPAVADLARGGTGGLATGSDAGCVQAADGVTCFPVSRTSSHEDEVQLAVGEVGQPLVGRTAMPPADEDGVVAGPEDETLGDEAVRRGLDRILRQSEQGALPMTEALARAAALSDGHLAVPGVSARLARLTRAASWRRLESAWSLSGVRQVPVRGWQPESPALRVRRALVPSPGESSVVHSGSALALLLLDPEALELVADLRPLDVGFLPPHPLTVAWSLDDAETGTVVLAAGGAPTRAAWSVPAGEHRLRFWIVEPVANQFARLDLAERRAAGGVASLVDEAERRYLVSTREEPVVLRLNGPLWLRVDERAEDGEGAWVTYRLVEAGWQTIELRPRRGTGEALLRVFVLEPAAAGVELAQRDPAQPLPMPLSQVEYRPAGGQKGQEIRLDRPTSGTWTGEATVVRRRLLEDREGPAPGPEEFVELGARRRLRLGGAGRPYLEGAIVGRLRDTASATLGVEGRAELPAQARRPTLIVSGTLYAQDLDGGPTEAAATLRGYAGRRFEVGRSWSHLPWLSVFARELTRGRGEPVPSGLDQDVFTRYKSDHRRGLTLGEEVSVDPAADLRLDAALSVTSNEDLDLTAPDNVTLRVQAAGLLGPLRLDLGYRFSRYLADGDRRESVDRQRLQLDLAWERWRTGGPRWEVAAGLRYDVDTDDLSGLLGLRWHRGHGRGLADFAPTDAPFRDLRTLRSLERGPSAVEEDRP